ncbi:MAG: hypothetical protein LQ342_004481 [Letrouitia transgressa]|nr:MAG: hypothetical protein LQ342_004481 [Letrouitia transgressa]
MDSPPSPPLSSNIIIPSTEQSPIELGRLRISSVELEREQEEYKYHKANVDFEEGLLPFSERKKLIRDCTRRISTYSEELLKQRQSLRLLEEEAGLAPPLHIDAQKNSVLLCALMAVYKEVKPSPMTPRDDAIEKYASAVGAPEKGYCGYLWCPVLHHWIEGDKMRCTHIVPHRLNRSIVDYIFEPGTSSRIETASNMLIIDRDVERHFNKGHIVFMPARPQQAPIMDWIVRVTNDDVRKKSLGGGVAVLKLGDLDYRKLRFKSSFRPAVRFLYFHFVMTLLINKRDKRGGWEKYLMELPVGKPFAMPGAYLRQSMLLALTEQAGDFNKDETVEVLDEEGHATFEEVKNMSKDEERDVAYYTTDCVRRATEE